MLSALWGQGGGEMGLCLEVSLEEGVSVLGLSGN